MTREIKFRDWDPETEEMRYFNLDQYDRTVHDAYGNIMQFTGLLDKNGKEIFENDIIVLSHPCWSVKCIVKYDNQLACYVLESFEKIDKGVRKSFLHIYQEDLNYKVIGNIYQNPELLTK
jgi:uncharacterized phage protein (TIGR01671 family)